MRQSLVLLCSCELTVNPVACMQVCARSSNMLSHAAHECMFVLVWTHTCLHEQVANPMSNSGEYRLIPNSLRLSCFFLFESLLELLCYQRLRFFSRPLCHKGKLRLGEGVNIKEACLNSSTHWHYEMWYRLMCVNMCVNMCVCMVVSIL